MTKPKKNNDAAIFMLDFIIVFSILSAIGLKYLIDTEKLDVSVRWVFLPGYALMLITFILVRLAFTGTKGGPDQ